MKTFYVNTGVQTKEILNFPYDYHRDAGNRICPKGVLTIPYDCDVPDDTPNNSIIIMVAESNDLMSMVTINNYNPNDIIIAKTNKDNRDLYAYILINNK